MDRKVLGVFVSTVLLGTVYSVMNKMQNITLGADGKIFHHPFFQSFVNSLGDALAIAVYYYREKRRAKLRSEFENLNGEASETPLPKFDKKFAIPALLAMVEKIFRNIALTVLAASVVLMLRSTNFIFCAFLALYFLKKKLYLHHYLAMIAITGGTLLVGFS